LDHCIQFENDKKIFQIYFTKLFGDKRDGIQNGNTINAMFFQNVGEKERKLIRT
jgi:hypothetical protein